MVTGEIFSGSERPFFRGRQDLGERTGNWDRDGPTPLLADEEEDVSAGFSGLGCPWSLISSKLNVRNGDPSIEQPVRSTQTVHLNLTLQHCLRL